MSISFVVIFPQCMRQLQTLLLYRNRINVVPSELLDKYSCVFDFSQTCPSTRLQIVSMVSNVDHFIISLMRLKCKHMWKHRY